MNEQKKQKKMHVNVFFLIYYVVIGNLNIKQLSSYIIIYSENTLGFRIYLLLIRYIYCFFSKVINIKKYFAIYANVLTSNQKLDEMLATERTKNSFASS